MYHVQARNKTRNPEHWGGEWRNATLIPVPLENAKARVARLRYADPSREYRIRSEQTVREESQP
jgi:hypothetical protein